MEKTSTIPLKGEGQGAGPGSRRLALRRPQAALSLATGP